MTHSRDVVAVACVLAAALGTLVMAGCGAGDDAIEIESGEVEAVREGSSSSDLLVDIAPETGLEFVHWNGMTGQRYFAEPVGSGGALVDLDNDGDLDVYLVQGRRLEPVEDPDDAADDPEVDGGRLFRNDLTVDADGRRHLRFTDITEECGVVARGYGMGVSAGDYDNDGRVDLYLTSFGSNQLWRNVSEGSSIRFENVTDESMTDDPRWSTSAAWVDLDADGWLDLYVANYVAYSVTSDRPCRSPSGRQDYCGPQSFSGEPDKVLRNLGDGTFADITGAAGMLAAPSSGLGVVAADFDLDGRIDVYVANDLQRNFLWRNLGVEDGLPRFENIALECGAAVSSQGRAQASMGLVAADLDNDGDDDLFMTHLSSDTNTLYVNLGNGFFDDRSAVSQLGMASLANTTFGTAALDIENDGWLDIITATGEIRVIEKLAKAGDPYPLKQPNQLFRNLGGAVFQEISRTAGREFERLEVSRGVAVGDVDNDGKSDVLLVNNNGPARLLHNRSASGNRWIGFRVIGPQGRDALGARVAVVRGDGSTLWRRVATDGSYLSSSDPRVLFGLGAASTIETVRVIWPDGRHEEWPEVTVGHYHTLTYGDGAVFTEEDA
jgi:hypothetical protein